MVQSFLDGPIPWHRLFKQSWHCEVVKDVCHGLQEEAHSCKEEPPAGQGDMERIQGEGAASPIASPIGFPQDPWIIHGLSMDYPWIYP